jgi:O-antigen ligase/Tfp pilus assembly protein PilF
MTRKKATNQQSSIQKPDNKVDTNNNSYNWISSLLLCLYLAVHFIPNLGGIDVMGAQWLYISLIDLLVVCYILARRSSYGEKITSIFRNNYTKLYLALYLWAAFSIFFAINPVESWVCFVRFTATVIAFFNISILFKNHLPIFRNIALLLSGVLFAESLLYFRDFFNDIDKVPLDQLINQLNGNTGNKNIFAASLVIKIPFILYCLLQAKTGERVFHLSSLTVGITTIFLSSARASFVSLFLITLCFLIFCFLQFRQSRKTELLLYRSAYIIIPLIAGFFLAKSVFAQANLYQERSNSGYSDISSRISSISLTQDNSSYRLALWKHAFSYIKEHPMMGCGYGNWKLASIPYEKEYINDLNVPAHAHNDFLEYFAELGIVGGLLYLSLFVCLLICTIKTWRSKADESVKWISVFSFMAVLSYAVDSALNFPIERPIMQVFFALVTAFNLGTYLMAHAGESSDKRNVSGFTQPLYGLICILLLIPTAYITNLTYQSLRSQMKIVPDLNNEPLQIPLDEVKNISTSIPNLTSSSQPIISILGRYYYENKQYDTALKMLRAGIPANPYIYYSEFLTANIYFILQQYDSANVYATKAFYNRPRANTYYQTFIAVQSRRFDTTAIEKAFKLYSGYRNEPFAWNLYLMGMLNAQRRGTPKLLAMADSALKLFKPPAGTEASNTLYQELLKRRTEILTNLPNSVSGLPVSSQDDINRATAIYNEGVAAFGKGDFATAASKFVKAASISAFSYSIYENAGVSYFNLKDYNKALVYFNKVIALKITTDGKSEFFRGICQINLGQKEAGCQSLQLARQKGYVGADNMINTYCK